jgi:capsid protein
LITNEINTGLTPESCPDEEILGLPEDSLNEWTETVENRFGLWAKNPQVCDWKKKDTFGAIQRAARAEALIEGDVLIVLIQNARTKVPMVQLISGSRVRTPLDVESQIRKNHTVKHGVELDGTGRQVGYWIVQDDGTSKRMPAVGEKSGRRLSWLVYGCDKRYDDIRGEPLLSLVLQSLKEIDRYRDSVQRKAVINSILAMFIQKKTDKPGTLPMTGAAVRRDAANITDSDGKQREFNMTKHIPGVVMEELQEGEEPKSMDSKGTDEKFGAFESAIIQAVAWANEIPPEILTLAFSNNYSASQAAINEFKIYLNKIWSDFGETVCTPVYVEWLIAETLQQNIDAPGLFEAWRDPAQYDIFGAWTSTIWYGSIKPSTDMLKQAKGSEKLILHGWTTNAREARITTGTKFSKNIKRLKRENQQKAEAMEPLAEFKKKYGVEPGEMSVSALSEMVGDLAEAVSDMQAIAEEVG